MRMNIHGRASAVLFGVIAGALGLAGPACAERFDTAIPMQDKGAATFYVASYLHGLGDADMMVDTGSGYLTINEVALKEMSAKGEASYVKELKGVLANGQELVVPVYRLGSLRIGKDCWIHDVEAAVFPGKTRFILGLSALSKASPFIFETNPPQLVVSNCGKTGPAVAAAGAAPAVQPLPAATATPALAGR